MIVDNLLKKGRPESGRPWFVGAVETFQETSLQRGYEIGAYAIRGVCDTGRMRYAPTGLFLDEGLRCHALVGGHAHEIHAVGEHLDRTKNGNLL